MKECDHKRIKRNFPFGKKSQPKRFCKDCRKIISAKEIQAIKKKNKNKQKGGIK